MDILGKARLAVKHRNSLETYGRWLFKINTNNYITRYRNSLITLTGIVVMSIALVILLGTMSLQAANAQNSSSNNSNIGTAKAPTANGTANPTANVRLTANGTQLRDRHRPATVVQQVISR